MTTTPRRAPKPAAPPAAEHSIPVPDDFEQALIAWQQQQPAEHSATTVGELLQLARSLNPYGILLRHELIETETSIRMAAVLEHRTGRSISSGPVPLPIQTNPGDFIQARILTTELVLGIARGEAPTAAAPAAPPAPAPAPKPAPAPTLAPAAAQPAAADQAEIEAVRLQVLGLPEEWREYIATMFRAEFGLAEGNAISPAIKSTEHVAFIRSILPAQPSAS